MPCTYASVSPRRGQGLAAGLPVAPVHAVDTGMLQERAVAVARRWVGAGFWVTLRPGWQCGKRSWCARRRVAVRRVQAAVRGCVQGMRGARACIHARWPQGVARVDVWRGVRSAHVLAVFVATTAMAMCYGSNGMWRWAICEVSAALLEQRSGQAGRAVKTRTSLRCEAACRAGGRCVANATRHMESLSSSWHRNARGERCFIGDACKRVLQPTRPQGSAWEHGMRWI
jgi:hypothetical protein